MIFSVYFHNPHDDSAYWTLDATWRSELSARTNAGWLSQRGLDAAVHDESGRLVFERRAAAAGGGAP